MWYLETKPNQNRLIDTENKRVVARGEGRRGLGIIGARD